MSKEMGMILVRMITGYGGRPEISWPEQPPREDGIAAARLARVSPGNHARRQPLQPAVPPSANDRNRQSPAR